MSNIGIIPARYASTRLPGKPLMLIGSRPMVQWVYEAAAQVLDRVVVATDDIRILRAVESFGGEGVLTSAAHTNGTSRVYEAYSGSGSDADVVVNIQGDEPFLPPEAIGSLAQAVANDPTAQIATLVRRCNDNDNIENLRDTNTVKAVLDCRNRAMYFSRALIPCPRADKMPRPTDYFVHTGIYAYRADVLGQLVQLSQSPTARIESLEQLTWLQHGYRIDTIVTDIYTIGVDTPEDLCKARQRAEKNDRI